MDVEVYNIKSFDEKSFEGSVLYIGRPSFLGNPFKINKSSPREEVIKKYRVWLLDKLKHSSDVRKLITSILGKSKEGKVALVCWCKPSSCHGDVIKEVIELCETYTPRLIREKWKMEGKI